MDSEMTSEALIAIEKKLQEQYEEVEHITKSVYPTIQGKQFVLDPALEEMMQDVLDKENIDIRPATVCCLIVYPNISRTTVAKVVKNSKETFYFSGYNYLLEVSGEAWEAMDTETRYKLVYHQLLHINPVFNEKKEDWSYKLKKHDFADFYEINTKYGGDYQKLIKATVSSLYDLNPNEEQNITF